MRRLHREVLPGRSSAGVGRSSCCWPDWDTGSCSGARPKKAARSPLPSVDRMPVSIWSRTRPKQFRSPQRDGRRRQFRTRSRRRPRRLLKQRPISACPRSAGHTRYSTLGRWPRICPRRQRERRKHHGGPWKKRRRLPRNRRRHLRCLLSRSSHRYHPRLRYLLGQRWISRCG